MLIKIYKLSCWFIDTILSYFGIDRYKRRNIKIDIDKLNNELRKDFNLSIPKINKDILYKEYKEKDTDVLGGVLRNIAKKEEESLILKLITIGPCNLINYFKYGNEISKDYKKINWNVDAISDNKLPNIRHHFLREELFFGHVDIKFMWEIARFHEMLSLSLLINDCKDETRIHSYLNEYTSRFYDFFASNPVGYGPHWTCSMEVGIRVINLIISISLLENRLSKNFYENINIFVNHSYNFICNNLENRSETTNNHYLTNLVAILFILKFSNDRTADYQKYSNEFIREINKQFNSDGSCFEGSTSYHCLSFELMKIGYFCLDDNKKALIHDKCINAGRFIDNIYFSNSEKHRIGDDDSGKIIKTIYDYIIKDDNVKSYPIEMINKDVKYKNSLLLEQYNIEKYLSNRYFDNHIFNLNFSYSSSDKDIEVNNFLYSDFTFPDNHSYHWVINDIFKNILYYPDFGAILIKYSNASLFFRVGGQNSGHRHEDELHIDLYIEGEQSFLDSGSVNYTLFSNVRNLYRSAKAHFVPYDSFAELNNLFKMNLSDKTKVFFSKSDNVYKISASYSEYRRDIFLYNNEIKILDYRNNIFISNKKVSVFLSSSSKYGSLSNEEVINSLSSL